MSTSNSAYYPHAGHQSDLNQLNALVEELSTVLASNRQEAERISASVNQLQAERAGFAPALPTTESDQEQTTDQASYQKVRQLCVKQNQRIINLESEVQEYHYLLSQYEDTLAGIMDKVRNCIHEHTTAAINLHKHYNGLLQKEKDKVLDLELQRLTWQDSIGRINTHARDAFNCQTQIDSGYSEEIAGYKREIYVLRGLLGWPRKDPAEEGNEIGDGSESNGPNGQSIT